MAAIKGMDGMNDADINQALNEGAKFVIFEYCISILIMTFKRSSDIYFVKSGESTLSKSLPFTLISLFFGWWGIPWGPIYTIGSLYTNLSGGKDMPQEVLHSLNK
jgi:hypothetical protein